MYTMMDAHFVTVILVSFVVLVTPFFMLATYVRSGAPFKKGIAIGTIVAICGGFGIGLCLADVIGKLGPAGNLIIPLFWILPSLILIAARGWFLPEPLSQRWLVGLQIFRAIGGVFLIEMVRGHIPGSFAYPAGVGDILVSLVALAVMVSTPRGASPSTRAVFVVAIFGLLDFASALFFGFTSSAGPQQLFAHGFDNQLRLFPTGIIPLFLVPYAIFFHTLSLLSLRMSRGE